MRVLAVIVMVLAFGMPPARADTTGVTSVAQLIVLEPGDSSYKLFHGAVWLELDKASVGYRTPYEAFFDEESILMTKRKQLHFGLEFAAASSSLVRSAN